MEPTADDWLHDLENPIFGVISRTLPVQESQLDTVRAILSMMSSRSSDTGFIEFMWGDSYAGGKDPTSWRKSSEIFIQFVKNGGRPVKYGQCWVGAECLSALLQVVGMKARTLILKNAIIDVGCNRGMDVLSGSKTGHHAGVHDDAVMDTITVGCSDWNMCIVPKAGERRPPDAPRLSLAGKPPLKQMPKARSSSPAVGIPAELKGDKKWNFHFITEVNIQGEWFSMDCTPCLARHERKPYYGPCRTSTIKSGVSDSPDKGFEHLFSLINGIPRYWSSFPLGKGTVFYPHTLDFSIYSPDHPSSISVKTGRDREDVTSQFRFRDRASAIAAYYARNPIMFTVWKRSLKITRMLDTDPEMRLQIVIIGNDVDEILLCKRTVVGDGSGLGEFLSDILPRGATKASILLMDDQKMYVQVIDIKEKPESPATLPR